jgi:hypothetical protein
MPVAAAAARLLPFDVVHMTTAHTTPVYRILAEPVRPPPRPGPRPQTLSEFLLTLLCGAAAVFAIHMALHWSFARVDPCGRGTVAPGGSAKIRCTFDNPDGSCVR